ncbi:MAG: ArnT family glycosyltransferase [Rhodanobacter sp.]
MLTTDSTSRNRWFWPLALFSLTMFALALRWYYVSTAVVLNPVRGDATQYYSYAWNLVHHGVFSKDVPGSLSISPDNYRDPGYPLLLALWMKVLGTGGAWYAAVLLCQALLGALTVTLTTQLGKYWLSPRWAIGAGLLMAVWPHSIAINGYLLTETLFGFLSALAMLLCARACRQENSWWAIVAGLAFGAAALTNAILLPFALLLAGFLGWRKLAARKICMALAVGALLLPGAWAVRNTQITAPKADSSSMDRALQNLVQGAWPSYHSAWRDSVLGDAATQARARVTLRAMDVEYDTLRASPVKGAKAILQRLGEHPLQYAAWYLFQKPYQLWDWDIQIGQGDIYVYPTQNAPFQTSPTWIALAAICHAINPLLMLLTLASLWVAWSRRHHTVARSAPASEATLVTVICLVAFATLVYTALQAEPRYSIAFRPFEMLLALTTLAGFNQGWQERRQATDQPAPISVSATAQHE